MKVFKKLLILLLLIVLVGCEQAFKPINLDEGEKNNGGSIIDKKNPDDDPNYNPPGTNDFTALEIQNMRNNFGFVIPYLENSNYVIEDGYKSEGEYCITFRGVAESDYNSFIISLNRILTYDDQYEYAGTTYYYYSYGRDIGITIYYTQGSVIVSVYIEEGGDNPVDYSNLEKEDMQRYFNFVVPFVPCERYGIEDTMNKNYQYTISFTGVTESDFNSFILQADKLFVKDEENSYSLGGISYYTYIYGDEIEIDINYYQTYLSIIIEKETQTPPPGPSVDGDFTSSEKQQMMSEFGFVLPFADGLEYEIVNSFGYYSVYFLDASQSDFTTYKYNVSLIATYSETYEYDGVTWYIYNYQDEYLINIAYYEAELEDGNSYIIDIYVSENQTADSLREALYDAFGFIIPLMGDNYEFYYDNCLEEEGYFNYYVCDVTESEFNTYKGQFTSSYGTPETDVDKYGDTWYIYYKDEAKIEIAYYLCEFDDGSEGYIIDVNLYASENKTPTGGGTGLPEGNNGIYNVDFKKAKTFKDVHDLTDYEYTSPTTGNVLALVIPVEFSDATAASKGYTIDAIKNAFLPKLTTQADLKYYSVSDYFNTSSYGKLNLSFDVLENWYTCEHPSSYYENLINEDGDWNGEQIILDEFLRAMDSSIDFSKYDANGDDCIDAIVLINTLEIDSESDNYYYWAFEYTNYITDDEGYYYEYDGVSANEYLWAAYKFLFEDEVGEFTSKTPTNTYTFIHEFSHVLGMPDLYDTAYVANPLEDYDMMDASTCDHNPFTKMYYGWITEARLITDSCTVELKSFEKNGDVIIFANNFDENNGIFQEYYIAVYYTNEELNDNGYGCFDSGVVVYHIDAEIAHEVDEYGDYYYLKNTNTDASDRDYGTVDNLVEFVKNGKNFIYTTGNSLASDVKDDTNTPLAFTFKVTNMTSREATLEFKKAN